jgi:hypothetical protein
MRPRALSYRQKSHGAGLRHALLTWTLRSEMTRESKRRSRHAAHAKRSLNIWPTCFPGTYLLSILHTSFWDSHHQIYNLKQSQCHKGLTTVAHAARESKKDHRPGNGKGSNRAPVRVTIKAKRMGGAWAILGIPRLQKAEETGAGKGGGVQMESSEFLGSCRFSHIITVPCALSKSLLK